MFGFRAYRRRRSPLPSGKRTYRAATTDAQKEVPHGAEPSVWVRGIHRDCASWAEGLAANWCRADRALLTRWTALHGALQNAHMELGRSREQEERSEAQRSAQVQLRPEEQNPMGDSLPAWGYALAMVLLTCMELPLVYMSFTAFGLPGPFTVLLSVLSAAITAFLGHAVGTVSRHMRVRARTMLAILVVLSGCFTGSLAWLREGAMEVIKSETATLNPLAAAWALFAISLASLAVASLLAWHHGVDPADRELYKARLLRRRWERQVERLRRNLSLAETRRWAAHEMARQDVLAVGEAMLSTFHKYARWNQLHRDKHDLPLCLLDEHLPKLSIPALLEQPLAWASQDLSL